MGQHFLLLSFYVFFVSARATFIQQLSFEKCTLSYNEVPSAFGLCLRRYFSIVRAITVMWWWLLLVSWYYTMRRLCRRSLQSWHECYHTMHGLSNRFVTSIDLYQLSPSLSSRSALYFTNSPVFRYSHLQCMKAANLICESNYFSVYRTFTRVSHSCYDALIFYVVLT